MFSEDGRRDPYPLYHELRSQAPVFRDDFTGSWFVSTFADCRAVLRDPTYIKGDRPDVLTLADGSTRERPANRTESMLFLNPPDHTRIRGLVSRAFTPRRIENLRPAIERLTNELLDDLGSPGDEVDLIGRFAFQLPVRVIAAMIGVPDEDRDWFRPRTADLVRSLEPTSTGADFDAAATSYGEIHAYMVELVAAKRNKPGHDLLSVLIEAEEAGDRLSEAELISNTILMFTAGFETTTNLIGNGVVGLVHHPAQLAALIADPSLWPNAIEELLRWDGPVQLDARQANVDVVLGGQDIPAGSQIVTLLGAANRDPASVADPDALVVSRAEVPILSFASGIHFCLGAALARIEGQVALQRLFERFPHLRLGPGPPVHNQAITIRGMSALPVTL